MAMAARRKAPAADSSASFRLRPSPVARGSNLKNAGSANPIVTAAAKNKGRVRIAKRKLAAARGVAAFDLFVITGLKILQSGSHSSIVPAMARNNIARQTVIARA